MSWSIRILCTENRSNTVDSLSASGDFKLFVELWGLGKISFFVEVWHSEYICTAFGSSSDQARRVKFLEAMASQIIAEVVLDSDSDVSDSLADRCSFVHSGVVEVGGQTGCWGAFCDTKAYTGVSSLVEVIVAYLFTGSSFTKIFFLIQLAYSSARWSQS